MSSEDAPHTTAMALVLLILVVLVLCVPLAPMPRLRRCVWGAFMILIRFVYESDLRGRRSRPNRAANTAARTPRRHLRLGVRVLTGKVILSAVSSIHSVRGPQDTASADETPHGVRHFRDSRTGAGQSHGQPAHARKRRATCTGHCGVAARFSAFCGLSAHGTGLRIFGCSSRSNDRSSTSSD